MNLKDKQSPVTKWIYAISQTQKFSQNCCVGLFTDCLLYHCNTKEPKMDGKPNSIIDEICKSFKTSISEFAIFILRLRWHGWNSLRKTNLLQYAAEALLLSGIFPIIWVSQLPLKYGHKYLYEAIRKDAPLNGIIKIHDDSEFIKSLLNSHFIFDKIPSKN